jgi:predicted dehydrogenase
MGRLRIGVVGVGHLGRIHARILSEMPGVDLVAVADVNEASAHSVGQRLGCTAYGHFRPLLGLVDAAVIAVPTSQHDTVAAEFLRSGIPLLIEKPLASDLGQAQHLVELAEGTLLQVGHIERFNPAFEELQQYRFQPKFIDCQRVGGFSGRSTDVGVVLDLMIHDLDIVRTLADAPVRSVEALGVSVFGGHEDLANARLVFENGCVATLSASRASPVTQRRMQVWALEGYAGLDYQTRRLTLIQPSEQVRRSGLNPATLDPASRAMLKEELFGRYLQVLERDCAPKVDQLTNELRHFVDCVRTGNRPRVTAEDGCAAVALATRILECVENHEWEGHAGPTGPHHLPSPHGMLFQLPPDRAAA